MSETEHESENESENEDVINNENIVKSENATETKEEKDKIRKITNNKKDDKKNDNIIDKI